jgi:hypothetical protein
MVATYEKGDSGISTIHDEDKGSRDTPQSPFSDSDRATFQT